MVFLEDASPGEHSHPGARSPQPSSQGGDAEAGPHCTVLTRPVAGAAGTKPHPLNSVLPPLPGSLSFFPPSKGSGLTTGTELK